MTTYRATLDLSSEELDDLRQAIHGDIELLKRVEGMRLATAAERELYARKRRSLGIVLHQLRTVTANDHDGGPVGSCRYAIR